jgi:hypothetical protein
MAAKIRAFLEVGGVIRKPPHSPDELAAWTAEADAYYEEFKIARDENPADPDLQSPEADTALSFLCKALRHDPCLVALHEGEAVAALAFDVKPGKHVFAAMVGSRGDPEGAGTSLEHALAEVAIGHNLGVVGRYIPTSRGFHVSIGRSVDVGLVKTTSQWTPEDCAILVQGIKDRL